MRESQRRNKYPLALGGGEEVNFLELLVGTGVALSEIDEMPELLARIADTALQMGQCEGCSIYEKEGETLRFLFTRNRVLEARNIQSSFKSFVLPISTDTIAGYCAFSKQVVNIPDVYHLSRRSPYTFNPSYDRMVGYHSKSMLVIPMCDSKGNVLGVLQLINHLEGGRHVPFSSGVESYLRALASQFGVVLRNVRMAEELKKSRIETVRRFVKASEYHDLDTGGHIERMSRYSVLLFEKMGFDAQKCEVIRLASMLHDVGKISIPDRVLKKPAKLDAEEWEIMKTHAENGYKMLVDGDSPFLQMGAVIALTHHEKWDGSGYPKGLKGEAIPIEGRVVALADVFDALCSKRCYKDAWPIEKVCEIIISDSGKHFDPDLVKLFFKHFEDVLKIKEEFPPEEAHAEVSKVS